MNGFIPATKQEMKDNNIERFDFILVTGDAYVDHPSFANALIARVLERMGYKVGIISQPRWDTDDDIRMFGRPRLAFLVSAGNMDSMVNHYSVNKIKRKTDSYSPGGRAGLRPDRATLVYSNLIKGAFKKVPVIIGGIEASLRRFSHYDYWSDKVRASYLHDSNADLLVYGMGENQIMEIAEYLSSGIDIKDITHVRGTVYQTDNLDYVYDQIMLPAYEEVREDKIKYAEFFKTFYENQDHYYGKTLVQKQGTKYIVQNPPMPVLSESELDWVYSLDFMRKPHPKYDKSGKIPALTEVRHSIISQRGCYGGCNFCALTFHQGRTVRSRSTESVVNEAHLITQDEEFKGYINDVGGPTANFKNPACKKQDEKGSCTKKQCLFPEACKNLEVDHGKFLETLRAVRNIEGVKKVFVRSGVRYDYMTYDDISVMEEFAKYHISGQLKVAPEHISDDVLRYMGKPSRRVYETFVGKYEKVNEKLGLKQFLVPYLMSSHPGSTIASAIELAEYLHNIGFTPKQVQDFYPTPGTLSTAMYHTGIDPRTMKTVHVPKTWKEKQMQRALLQYKNPRNYDLVHEALISLNRYDLIGNSKKCLIKPKD